MLCLSIGIGSKIRWHTTVILLPYYLQTNSVCLRRKSITTFIPTTTNKSLAQYGYNSMWKHYAAAYYTNNTVYTCHMIYDNRAATS